jgi:hypothetical protein
LFSASRSCSPGRWPKPGVLALAVISPSLASRSTALAKLIPRRLVPDVPDQARVATL